MIASVAVGIRYQGRVAISPRSVAVAQFTAAEPAVAYLASGITGRLIDTLTEIPGLRVVGSAVRDKAALADFPGLQQSTQTRALLMGWILNES